MPYAKPQWKKHQTIRENNHPKYFLQENIHAYKPNHKEPYPTRNGTNLASQGETGLK